MHAKKSTVYYSLGAQEKKTPLANVTTNSETTSGKRCNTSEKRGLGVHIKYLREFEPSQVNALKTSQKLS